MVDFTITAADPTTPQARALLRGSHDLMSSLFPQAANHYLSVEALAAPHVDFFVAGDGDVSLGCVALADFETYGEVKSFFVDPAARGRGIAGALLAHLERAARARDLPVLKLETGQPGLEAAHRLYARHGFADCAAFGDYEADAPYSRYMELSL